MEWSPLKVVAAESVEKFELESDSYLDALEIEEYMDIGTTCRELVCGWVMVSRVGVAQAC